LLRRLVFGHRILTFPHLFFFLEQCFRACAAATATELNAKIASGFMASSSLAA
jgi:hypothetical protein